VLSWVVAEPTDEGHWAYIRIVISEARPVGIRQLGSIGVDWARFAFADADALSAWEHERPIDGLGDVVFWGVHEDAVAAEFGATRTSTPGDDRYGWLNLPIQDAYEKAVALDARRNGVPDQKFAFDFRPHSHHWQVMAAVRASDNQAATIDIAGARILFAMTSVGDGFFPVHMEHDAAGAPVAIHVSIMEDDEEDLDEPLD
jgi:hypothetical protein